MRELLLIGVGLGNPDHVTGEAIKAMNRADMILIPRKGADKSDLADLRRQILDVHLANATTQVVEFDVPARDAARADYRGGVLDWHDAVAEAWRTALASGAPKTAALLVWGDPSLYDSTMRISERFDPRPEISVIPGITAVQALTAAHAIPVNEIGAPFTVTTGRRLREHGWPRDADTIVAVAKKLLRSTAAGDRPVRLLGVTVSGFEDETTEQLELFETDASFAESV